MVDAQKIEVARAIQRESDKLAAMSARLLAQSFAQHFAGGQQGQPPATAPEHDPTGLAGNERGPQNADEMIEMARNGFVRLGSVLALSVMVDEPGLIADDMRWLTRLFGARNVGMPTPGWLSLLLRTYADACDAVLTPEMSAQARDMVERSIVLLEADAEQQS